MPLSVEQFRESIRAESESNLKQRFDNCRANAKLSEYAIVVKRELDSRFPGWDKPKARRGGSRQTIARFHETEHEFDSARAAYIWLVERFTEYNSTLFTDIRWETTGYVSVGRRKGVNGAARNYFAKTPIKLFRQTPSLADNRSNYHQLLNGWYLNLNLNTRENFEILCRFAAVSKLIHRKDWDWVVLDPTEQLHDTIQRTTLAEEMMKEMFEFLGKSSPTDR